MFAFKNSERGTAIFLSMLSAFASAQDAQNKTPRGKLIPLQIQSACGARAAGRVPPDEPDYEVGRVFIHSVLSEGQDSGKVLIELDCTYHWTDGALNLPSWLSLRDRFYRQGSWSCKYNGHYLWKSLAALPLTPFVVTTLNQPGLEDWQGWFDISLGKRGFSILPANKQGLGMDVGLMPGWLTLTCPIDVGQWDSATEAKTQVMQQKSTNTMKGCRIRVENKPTHRVAEGRCDGTTEVPGFWFEAPVPPAAK